MNEWMNEYDHHISHSVMMGESVLENPPFDSFKFQQQKILGKSEIPLGEVVSPLKHKLKNLVRILFGAVIVGL